MSDFTYLETREGWLFLAGVLDAYSRKIVGWSMSEHHDTELVQTALRNSGIFPISTAICYDPEPESKLFTDYDEMPRELLA
jgi:hypothetical protein